MELPENCEDEFVACACTPCSVHQCMHYMHVTPPRYSLLSRTGADGSFFLPMCGFTQSFNISVAAAMSLWAAIASEAGKWRKFPHFRFWRSCGGPHDPQMREIIEIRFSAAIASEAGGWCKFPHFRFWRSCGGLHDPHKRN